MRPIILSILILAMAMVSCKAYREKREQKKIEKSKSIAQEMNREFDSDAVLLQRIHINREYQWPRETDPFRIISQTIHGDTLIMMVEYGGGCKEHEFKMNFTGAWMKSLPPKAELWLEHQNNDDNCRALVVKNLYFDLTPLKYAGSKNVKLIINSDEEGVLQYGY